MSGFADIATLQVPHEIGIALAEGMRGEPALRFQQRLDAKLEQMQAALLDEGRSAQEVLLICQTARRAAEEERRRATEAF